MKTNQKSVFQYLGSDLCAFDIIIFICLSFSIFLVRINFKIAIDNYYISHHKIIIFIGVLGFVIDLIISIIFVFIDTYEKCQKKRGKYNNIFCYNDLLNYFSLFSDIKFF